MAKLVSIALGGAVGALLRYGLSALPARYLGGHFPYGTLLVNLLGCFLIGLLWSLLERAVLAPSLRPFLITGFLGALTTFSTYGLDNLKLFQQGQTTTALAYILLSNLLGLLFVLLGAILGK